MDKVTVRLAENSEGERVKYVVEQQHGAQEPCLKWDTINPYWLVAELRGEIVGVIQTRPARPMGGLESLATLKSLSQLERALVCREMAFTGMGVLMHHGATQVQMFVPEELADYRDVLVKRGAVILDTGYVLAKRIA